MANIAIVGGGVSGLSAGIYAAKSGHRVTIYEAHDKAGGNLTGWEREGCHIDNCIHWLTGTNAQTTLYQMWEELGALGEVEVYQGERLYTFEKEGRRASLYKSLANTESEMRKLSPRDKGEIRALVRAVRAAMHLSGIAGKSNEKKSSLHQRILGIPALLRYYPMTTGELASRFCHPVLQGFIKSLMGEDFGALALIVVFATFCGENGGVPVGGSFAMAERMTARFRQLGGTLRLKTEVVGIRASESETPAVCLKNGAVESADYVVVATDPAVAFGKLLHEKYMPRALRAEYRNPRLYRFSSLHAAFLCERERLAFQGDLIVEIPKEYRKSLAADYLVLREFSHERSFAPDGKSLLQAMVYSTEKTAKEYIALRRDKEAYKAKKEALARDIKKIAEAVLPSLKGTLRCIDVWTPATYQRYVNSEIGSWMSFGFSGGFLPRRLPFYVKGLKNVLLATQWLQSPGGLPTAAGVGKEAALLICKKERALLKRREAPKVRLYPSR